ncbi:MAG: PIN domain-containing protein [Candidatus Melainabacteria bacterium]|nr:PIN domain-containing protein [Candidatus Melainabacteria bacterium]
MTEQLAVIIIIMIKKTKLYIDTSIWNLALETNRSEYRLTIDFLEVYGKSKSHLLCISEVVEVEINRAYDTRRKQLLRLVEKYQPEILTPSNESYNLAKIYTNEGLMPSNAINDAIHIAVASLNHCDFIVSWNFQHIVRARTIKGVHVINLREGYSLIEIVSPREFVSQ